MRTLIRNIGQIVSGDIARPLVDGDSIVIDEGPIRAVGTGREDDADTVIDVANLGGCEHIVLNPLHWGVDQLERLAGEIMPRVTVP